MACPGFTPEKDAPRAVTRRLTRFGGTNPYNEPLWRLVLADHRYDLRAGIFHRRPDGKTEVFKQSFNADGHVVMTHESAGRDTIEYGLHPVKKWPCDGWVLERWYPNHVWGSREWWEDQRAADGITPILGEYPARGDYWMQAGPWPLMPDLDDIETAIAQWEWEMNNNPANLDLFLKSELATQQAEELKRQVAVEEELAAFVRAEIDPIWKSTTLEAARIRQDAARAAGQTSHATL